MDHILILSNTVAALTSLYLFFIHLFRRKSFSMNRIFLLISLLVFFQYSLIILLQIKPVFYSNPLITRSLLFIPLAVFTAVFLIASIYPDGKIKDHPFSAAITVFVIATDLFMIYFSTYGGVIKIDPVSGIQKNYVSIIQIALILIFIAIDPVVLLIKAMRLHMSRIRYSVIFYLSGILASYALFLALYYAGFHFRNLTLLKNPFLPVPAAFMLVITGYLLLDIRNNDFKRFYKKLGIYIFSFIVYFIPVYFFLKYLPQLQIGIILEILAKSSVVFIYIVGAYRILNLLDEFIMKRNLEILIQDVDNTVVPVHELKKITDMERFWNFITRENFQGLRQALGIKSAYFMLYNRKDNGYSYTYGFGPGLEPAFLHSDSSIIRELSAYKGIFEKSYLLTDVTLQSSREEIAEFFTSNRLEAAVAFRNMSDAITGFLFLGTIEEGKAYTADVLEALEILRIKLQSLLITGLILDEVTADQVSDHDRIVVSTVKKRIIPEELISIPGIRMSSLYINNSMLGGDYFDAVRIGKDSSIIFIAEASYNGIESALASLELFSILHSRTMTFNSAEKVLNTMNQVLKTSRISQNFIRSSCVIVSSDGNFTYSNASLNPMIIFDMDKGSFSEVETTSIPLAIEMDYRYTLTSAKLRENSIGIMYSGGFLSACNESGEPYPLDRLKETVKKFCRQNPSIITREIYKDLNSYTSGKDQANDVTVLIFKKVKTADE